MTTSGLTQPEATGMAVWVFCLFGYIVILLFGFSLTLVHAEELIVISVGGSPTYRNPGHARWTPLAPGCNLQDSTQVDISISETVLVRSSDGRIRTLTGIYRAPVGASLGRMLHRRPNTQIYQLSEPVATVGVRGDDRTSPGSGSSDAEAVYRHPRDLWNALTDAVRRGDAGLFPTFFTDETLSDSSFGEYIRMIQAVLPYPDSIVYKMQRLDGYPATFLSKEDIIGDFAEWFRAVNTEPDGENFRYEISSYAVEPLRNRVRKYRGDLVTFAGIYRNFIELQIHKYESDYRRMPSGVALHIRIRG